MYRQHNNPDRFLKYFEESVERYSATGKQLCILGDYNLDLSKGQLYIRKASQQFPISNLKVHEQLNHFYRRLPQGTIYMQPL